MSYQVRRAALEDIDSLAVLFDAYRSFYGQASDLERARDFLCARLSNQQSVLLVAEERASLLGFAQLYPSFSSVRASRVWILNDLFVTHDARRRGVARALADAAIDFARSDGAIRVELETMPDNNAARALYEVSGWQRYDETLRYHYVTSC